MRNMPVTTHQSDSPGIGPKKTLFVLMTVVGCIAILWPKVFYPMMMGGSPPKQPAIKGHHGTGLRQERPPHLRKEGIHPAMLEKGRAIPHTQTIPVVSRPAKAAPIMVEGRPGPIPGLRPPLGAGSVHKAQPKSNSMSFIMPLYTIGIIAFFVYTIMKLLFKKPVANSPYGAAKSDPNFRKEVFEEEPFRIKRPDDGTTKLGANCQPVHASCNCGEMHVNGVISSTTANNQHQQHQIEPLDQESLALCENFSRTPSNGTLVRERDQLMEIEKLRKKLEDTEQAMAKLIAEMGCDSNKAKDQAEHTSPSHTLTNGHTKPELNGDIDAASDPRSVPEHGDESSEIVSKKSIEKSNEGVENKKHIESSKAEHPHERTVQVLGMELTASCEGGQRWARPPTPLFSHRPHSPDEEQPEKTESIFLEGALPRESQILVADSETRTEEVVDETLNGSLEEPAVVLSSKMTLSLINLNAGEEHENLSSENDSPIGEDIEIINGAEKESSDKDEAEAEEDEKPRKSNE